MVKRHVVLALVAAAAPLFVVIPAQASISQPHVVSEDPANFTPNVQSDGAVPNPAVYALAQRNGQIYAGGEFQTIADASQSKTFARTNLMSFSATTGQMSNLSPDINAPVWAVRPRGSALYVGGEFTQVNGIARRAIVIFPLAAGGMCAIRLAAGRAPTAAAPRRPRPHGARSTLRASGRRSGAPPAGLPT